MFPEITRQTLPLLIPGKAAGIADALRKDRHLPLKTALLTFYHSPVYALLEREETKLWHRSAAQIYAEYFPETPVKKTCQNGPGRSKLAPFREQILAWRKQGLSLQNVVDRLAEMGCFTTPQNICQSLKRKSQSPHPKSVVL